MNTRLFVHYSDPIPDTFVQYSDPNIVKFRLASTVGARIPNMLGFWMVESFPTSFGVPIQFLVGMFFDQTAAIYQKNVKILNENDQPWKHRSKFQKRLVYKCVQNTNVWYLSPNCNSPKLYLKILTFDIYDLGPGSLPGYARRRMGPGGEFDDGASDISSTSGFSAYGYRNGKLGRILHTIEILF